MKKAVVRGCCKRLHSYLASKETSAGGLDWEPIFPVEGCWRTDRVQNLSKSCAHQDKPHHTSSIKCVQAWQQLPRLSFRLTSGNPSATKLPGFWSKISIFIPLTVFWKHPLDTPWRASGYKQQLKWNPMSKNGNIRTNTIHVHSRFKPSSGWILSYRLHEPWGIYHIQWYETSKLVLLLPQTNPNTPSCSLWSMFQWLAVQPQRTYKWSAGSSGMSILHSACCTLMQSHVNSHLIIYFS